MPRNMLAAQPDEASETVAGRTIRVLDPATGELVSEVPVPSPAEVGARRRGRPRRRRRVGPPVAGRTGSRGVRGQRRGSGPTPTSWRR